MIPLEIETIAFGGEGIAHNEGKVFFVPFTAPGDKISATVVKEKKQCSWARADRIISSGPDRIAPLCPHYTVCGGCQLQHLSYEAQCRAKENFVEQNLRRIGKIPFPPLTPIASAEQTWYYRRHVTLHLKREGRIQIGYYGAGSHEEVPITQCPIFSENLPKFLPELRALLELLYKETPLPETCRLFSREGDTFLVSLFSDIPTLSLGAEELKAQFPLLDSLAIKQGPKELLIGKPTLSFSLGGKTISYSPFGFVQNHPEMSEKLYLALAARIEGVHPLLLDLYSGVGATSVLLADKFEKIIAVESNHSATRLAEKNFKHNQITHAKAMMGQVELLLPELLQPKATVLLNPPRTGLDPLIIEAIRKQPPNELFYISCMPPTLARDLKALHELGYRIEFVQPFDLFPQTTHVETLVHCRLAN